MDETKLMIIENYINWFTSNEQERQDMIRDARIYVEEDHVNELKQTNKEQYNG